MYFKCLNSYKGSNLLLNYCPIAYVLGFSSWKLLKISVPENRNISTGIGTMTSFMEKKKKTEGITAA